MTPARLRRAIGDACRQPGLLVLCGLIGAGELATWVLVAPYLQGASRPAAVAWLISQRLLLLVVLAALLPGCYAIARERAGPRASLTTVRESLSTAAERTRADGERLLLSLLVSRALALALTVALAAVALALVGWLDTASVWTDAYLGTGLDRGLLALGGVPAAVLGAAVLAGGAVDLHDLRAIDGDDPARAPLWSLRAWRGRPGRFLAYALVRALLLGLPILASAGIVVAVGAATDTPLGEPSIPTLALAAIVFVAATALARGTLVTYKLDAFERSSGTVARALVPQSRRALLAAVVILAAMTGVAAVRMADVHPPLEDVPEDIEPANASATVETAIERTRARSRITTERTEAWNASAGRWDETDRFDALVDPPDREVVYHTRVPYEGNITTRSVYSTDGRFAMLRVPRPPASPDLLHFTLERNSWTVLIGPPYGWAIEQRLAFPPADAPWRLTDQTEDRLVYRIDAQALAGRDMGPVPHVPEGPGVTVGNDTYVTMEIDRGTLTVVRVSASVDYVEDGQRVRQRWERRLNKIGTIDVSRPGSLPPPSAPARFWDVVYY